MGSGRRLSRLFHRRSRSNSPSEVEARSSPQSATDTSSPLRQGDGSPQPQRTPSKLRKKNTRDVHKDAATHEPARRAAAAAARSSPYPAPSEEQSRKLSASQRALDVTTDLDEGRYSEHIADRNSTQLADRHGVYSGQTHQGLQEDYRNGNKGLGSRAHHGFQSEPSELPAHDNYTTPKQTIRLVQDSRAPTSLDAQETNGNVSPSPDTNFAIRSKVPPKIPSRHPSREFRDPLESRPSADSLRIRVSSAEDRPSLLSPLQRDQSYNSSMQHLGEQDTDRLEQPGYGSFESRAGNLRPAAVHGIIDSPIPSEHSAAGTQAEAARDTQAEAAKHAALHGIADSPTPIDLTGIVDLRNTEDTVVHERQAPAVIHETIIEQVHEITQEEITREIHNYHYYHRVLPVVDIEVLPARHFVPSERGPVEIPAAQVPGHLQAKINRMMAEAVQKMHPQNEQLSSPRQFSARKFEGSEGDYKEYTTADGVKRTESWWVHPPSLATGAVRSGITHAFHIGAPDPADDGFKWDMPNQASSAQPFENGGRGRTQGAADSVPVSHHRRTSSGQILHGIDEGMVQKRRSQFSTSPEKR